MSMGSSRVGVLVVERCWGRGTPGTDEDARDVPEEFFFLPRFLLLDPPVVVGTVKAVDGGGPDATLEIESEGATDMLVGDDWSYGIKTFHRIR